MGKGCSGEGADDGVICEVRGDALGWWLCGKSMTAAEMIGQRGRKIGAGHRYETARTQKIGYQNTGLKRQARRL